MYQFYNIKTYYKPSTGVRVIVCIVNSLIEAIEERNRLPRLILFIFNKDIIADLDVFNDDVVTTMRSSVDWLIKQINILIRCKCAELLERKPGAVYVYDPSLIFVRMLHRHDITLQRGSKKDEIFSLRAKFNDALNMAVAWINHRMLTINSCNSGSHFTHLGELSQKGKDAFWYETDDLVERFDKNEVKLLPTPLETHKQCRRHLTTPHWSVPPVSVNLSKGVTIWYPTLRTATFQLLPCDLVSFSLIN